MINVLAQIYDSVFDLVKEYGKDYFDALTTQDVRMKEFVDYYRQSVDMYKLPAYPSLVMGYGEITFQDEHTTTSEWLDIPVSLYAVTSGMSSDVLQKMSENYVYALWSLFMGEDWCNGEIYTTAMGMSPTYKQTNQTIQVGYIDLRLEVNLQRKQEV